MTLGQNSATSTLAAGSGQLDVGSLLDSSPSGSMVTLNSIVVGDAGVGTLEIGMGATLASHSSSLVVGNQFGSNGTVTMNGPLSQFLLNSGATVDVGLHGTGVFTIQNNATFDADNFMVGAGTGSEGTANVTGTGAAVSAELLYDDNLVVGGQGSGNLVVTMGGFVAPSGTGVGNVTVGGSYYGTLSVRDDATLFEANNMIVGGPSAFLGGSVKLANGATMEVANMVTIGPGGSIDVAGDFVEVPNLGQIPIYNGGGLTIGSTSTLAADNQILVNPGGILSAGHSFLTTEAYGELVNNGGTILIGDPVSFGIYGDYDQISGELDLEFDGESNFDQIDATGGIDITGGTIDLDFDDGFAPKAGDTFDLLDGTPGDVDVSGVTFKINGLEPGFDYQTMIDPQTGAYELYAVNDGVAIPEPASALLGLGLGLLALAKRRTRD